MASHSHSHQNAVIRTYLGLLLLTVCVFALMYCPQPMLYTLSQEFGVSKSNSALLVSVFMFFLVISPMCVGILLDRIGVRKALLVSTFLVGISGAGIYFAPNFLVLVGVRSFEALFVPVLVTSIMVSIASMFRHMDFNRALAGYVSCTLVGSLWPYPGWLVRRAFRLAPYPDRGLCTLPSRAGSDLQRSRHERRAPYRAQSQGLRENPAPEGYP